jgi:hypothetical protein
MGTLSLPGRRLIGCGLLLLLVDLVLMAVPLWYLLPPEPRVVIQGKHTPYWLSPDGGRLYMDGKLWDTRSGEVAMTFFEGVNLLIFAPDGRHVAGVNDSSILFGDWHTGREWSVELPGLSSTSQLKFSLDGDLLAVRTKVEEKKAEAGKEQPKDERIVMLETASGRILDRLDVDEAIGGDFSEFTRQGEYFVYAATVNKTAQTGLWNTRTRRLEAMLKTDGSVLAISPDCRTLLIAGELAFALWDLDPAAKRPRANPLESAEQNNGNFGFVFSRNSRLLATFFTSEAKPPGVLELWEVETGRRIAQAPNVQHGGGEFSPDGTRFALSSYYMAGKKGSPTEHVTLRLHEVSNGEEVWARTWYGNSGCYPQFSISGSLIKVYVEGQVEFLDPTTGRTRAAAPFHRRPRVGSQFWGTDPILKTPDGRLIVYREDIRGLGREDRWIDRVRATLHLSARRDWDSVHVLEMETGRALIHLEEIGTTGPALLADNGRTLVTQHADFIAVWDVPAWPPLRWAVGVPLGVWPFLCLAVWLLLRKRKPILVAAQNKETKTQSAGDSADNAGSVP